MAIIGGQANPNGTGPLVTTERLNKTLVVENVSVIEVTKRVEVPQLVYVPTEQVRYVTREEETTKFNTVLKETLRYIPKEEPTTKYVIKEEQTIRYTPKEVEVEVPKWVNKDVEIPVKKEVPLEVLTIQNLEQVKGLIKSLPEIIKGLNDAVVAITAFTEDIKTEQKEVAALRGTKLVEEVIKVPRLEWHTIEAERIVWKDVPRERVI
mgnify:CR=1 FL=1